MKTFKIEVSIKSGLNNNNLGSIAGLQNLSVENYNFKVDVKKPTTTLIHNHYVFFFNEAHADKVEKIINDMSVEVRDKVNVMIGNQLIEASKVTVNELLK
ncbi:hypothetical protein BUY79_12580 [Staphylococcus equorum]|uniref:hypothetical protein n=1 Tax=Staphylococcus equorum TaxID=246432 RepID=UPI000D1D0D18|nr:hypothetical protein [Staphylococcus equorum]PTE82517.1 hypothetical protein BUY79_12580 [Staphylococcus equorum]